MAIRAGVEDGRPAEGELESSDNTPAGSVGTECCGGGDAVARAVARLAAVNEEGTAGARGVAGFVLTVAGPGEVTVQLVFVDDMAGRGLRTTDLRLREKLLRDEVRMERGGFLMKRTHFLRLVRSLTEIILDTGCMRLLVIETWWTRKSSFKGCQSPRKQH